MKIVKICNELPDMYIPMADMGRFLAGWMATSQAFFIFRVSISSVEGPFLGFVRAASLLFLSFLVSAVEGVKPGGSWMMVVDLGFVVGGVFRSRTHWGGGGGGSCAVDMLWLFQRDLYVVVYDN